VFIVLVAAAAFSCPMPAHPDGMSLRCADSKTMLALDGLRVQPPFDTCEPWQFCAADPGTASRDHLADLTRGQTLKCRYVAGNRVRCRVADRDLSCTMVADGQAVAARTLKDCPPIPVRQSASYLPERLSSWEMAAALAMFNAAALVATAFDHYRARRGFGGVPDRLVLLLALLGGAPGLLVGQMVFRDDSDAAGPTPAVFIILGLQIGAIVGALLL
jgi:uncharacterized membrane protein YsdA (DUF1294 family)